MLRRHLYHWNLCPFIAKPISCKTNIRTNSCVGRCRYFRKIQRKIPWMKSLTQRKKTPSSFKCNLVEICFQKRTNLFTWFLERFCCCRTKSKMLSTLLLLFGNDKLLALFDELNGYEWLRESVVFVAFVGWFVWTSRKVMVGLYGVWGKWYV